MRVLVISDIHANLTALEAVLEDAPKYDAVWCLGDTVGYGPDPNECIERVSALPELICLIGNHDQAVLGLIPLSRFNRDAGAAAAWTQEILKEENRAYLETLPSKVTIEEFTLAHGSPNQPIWEYILDPMTADRNFDALETDYCLIGHSHLPLIFQRPRGDSYAVHLANSQAEPVNLAPQMILNPGSVGQPRDGNPQAAYALLDTGEETWEMRRVEYDVKDVQTRIIDAGLPDRHAIRIMVGW
jgi:predicted phosphodiesterase